MTEVKAKMRNCSIDIFRFVCAIMVVAIHTHPFADVNKELGYIFTQIIPRIGVPFFFAVAGFFYTQKLEKGQESFLPYIKRLLITYFIWSCFYYIIDFAQGGYLNLKEFVISCVYQFVITGSHYHFWFFPALIFAVCLTTLMFKVKYNKVIVPLSIILYIVGCLGSSYYELGIHVPILGKLFMISQFSLIRRILLMGFPFFTCGYLVYKIKDKIFGAISNKSLLIIWIAVTIIWLAEIGMVIALRWQNNIIITEGLYLLVVVTLVLLLRNPLPKYKSFSNKSRVLANFTYYSHPFWIACLDFMGNSILHVTITETPMFFMTIGLSCIGGLVIYKWDNKLVNFFVN